MGYPFQKPGHARKLFSHPTLLTVAGLVLSVVDNIRDCSMAYRNTIDASYIDDHKRLDFSV